MRKATSNIQRKPHKVITWFSSRNSEVQKQVQNIFKVIKGEKPNLPRKALFQNIQRN